MMKKLACSSDITTDFANSWLCKQAYFITLLLVIILIPMAIAVIAVVIGNVKPSAVNACSPLSASKLDSNKSYANKAKIAPNIGHVECQMTLAIFSCVNQFLSC